MNTELRLYAVPVVDCLNLDERTVGVTFAGRTRDNDLLYQPKLEGADRVQPIDEVIGVLMRGRIPQCAEWV